MVTIWSCNSVQDLFKDTYPHLDEQGIMVSADRVAPRDTVIASISATNPLGDGPLTYEWSTTNGTFMAPADKDTVKWIAPSSGGLETIRVRVSNSRHHSDAQKQIAVISSNKPLVDIIEPEANAYFVLQQNIAVQATAEHDNGIAVVRLYVNNHLQAETDARADNHYRFTFKADSTMVGTSWIKVEAEASNQWSVKGSDSLAIQIGGIVIGKK